MKKNISSYKFIIVSILSIVLQKANALAEPDVVGHQWVALNNSGNALVTTRKIEGKLGKPYTVELRVSCNKNKKKNWEVLPIVDMESVCDVKPKSAKLSSDGKYISILIRETDADAYNTESKLADAKALGEIQPRCKKSSKEFLFSIEKYCQH